MAVEPPGCFEGLGSPTPPSQPLPAPPPGPPLRNESKCGQRAAFQGVGAETAGP